MDLIDVDVPVVGPPQITGDRGHWLPALRWLIDYWTAVGHSNAFGLENVVPASWFDKDLPAPPIGRAFAVISNDNVQVTSELQADDYPLAVSGEGYTDWAIIHPIVRTWSQVERRLGEVEPAQVFYHSVARSDLVIRVGDESFRVTPFGVTGNDVDVVWSAMDEMAPVEEDRGDGIVEIVDYEPTMADPEAANAAIFIDEGRNEIRVITESWIVHIHVNMTDVDVELEPEEPSALTATRYRASEDVIAIMAELVVGRVGNVEFLGDGSTYIPGVLYLDDLVAGGVALAEVLPQIPELANSFTELQAQFQSTVDSVVEMQKSLNVTMDGMGSRLGNLEDALPKLRSTVEEAINVFAKIKDRLNILLGLSDRFDKIENEHVIMQDKVSTLNSELDAFHTSYEQYKHTVSQRLSSLESAISDLDEIRTTQSSHDTRLNDVESDAAQLNNKLSDIRARTIVLEEKDYQDQLDLLAARVSQLESE